MSMIKKIAYEKARRTQEKMDKNIVLFDMDGTLTPSRGAFDLNLLQGIRDLSMKAEIGIISGSGLNYIQEQMDYLLTKTELRFKLHLLPCNGTKYYKPPIYSDQKHELKFSCDMKTRLGDQYFYELMKILLELQEHISRLYIPLSGYYIDYRGSMVNWCPIGREASAEERALFVGLDNAREPHYLRKDYLSRLQSKLSRMGLDKEIVCTLGGDTSFDIYPAGWDKTFALRHFRDKDVWFVGDRCEEGGNDKTLYDKLRSTNRSFKTKGPQATGDIIQTILGELK